MRAVCKLKGRASMSIAARCVGSGSAPRLDLPRVPSGGWAVPGTKLRAGLNAFLPLFPGLLAVWPGQTVAIACNPR